jgi:PAT family beta-lactamase induction signal transducer AmpG
MSEAQRFTVRDLIRDRDTALRFTSVAGLQMGQIFPASFIGLFLPVIFREQGLPLDMYWVFTLPAIPTWLRPLWAPLVDRTGSRVLGMRKSWFLPCTIFGALAYLVLSLFAPTLDNLALIITLLVVKTTIMTTQDIAIDGYMVENIRDEERPVGAAVLDVGRNVARFIAWAGIAWLYTAFGWSTALATAAGLLLAFSLPGIIRPEPPRPVRHTRERPSLTRLLKRPDSQYVFPLCFSIALVGSLIPALYPTYLSDLGFSLGNVAAVVAPATLIGSVLGATVTSWFLGRFGYKTTLLVAACCILLAVLPIMWMGSLPAPTFVIVFLVTLNGIALPSFLDVTFQAARLKWASRSQAATDYTTQIVTMMAGASLATAVGGLLAEHLGWFYYFMLAGILISGACFLLYGMFDRVEAVVDARDARDARAQAAAAELPPATAAFTPTGETDVPGKL